jgi:hypothetical protein
MERLVPTLKKSDVEPLAVPIKQACEMAGHSHDLGYAKARDGRWETYLDGGKRMVTMRSIKADMERCIAAQRGGFVPAEFHGHSNNQRRRRSAKAEERAAR